MFRSIGLLSEIESEYYAQLSVSEEYSFLKKAFESNMDIANAAYNTTFIQGNSKWQSVTGNLWFSFRT